MMVLILISFMSIFVGCGESYSATYNPATMVNVANYGAVGDNVVNDKSAIDNATTAALAAGKDVYFPDGTYSYIGAGLNAGIVNFFGQSKLGTIITDNNAADEHNISGAQDITFYNFKITDYGVSTSRLFRNCKFVYTGGNSSYYVLYQGLYTDNTSFSFYNCDFDFGTAYVGIWLRKYNSVVIDNCTFSGNAWHNIRVSVPNGTGATVSITRNTVTGGATGIFVGSNREFPLVGGLIENNTVTGQSEESISLDGFGNNYDLVPVIANGTITSASNDGNGRLVVSMDNAVYHNGVLTNQPSPVSLRTDWTNFYFTLGQGSGQPGTVAKVYAYDNVANTLTIDSLISAATLTVGGDFGVQSGFFDWIIRGNTISESYGVGGTYATALSIYLNVFGIMVDNNTVFNCANGINLAGGLMLSTYQTLAYNNIVKNNIFRSVLIPAYFRSYYPGHKQYGNQFINNTIIGGGNLFFEQQGNFTYAGNVSDIPLSNYRLIYFQKAGTCTKLRPPSGSLSIGGTPISQAICIVENDGVGNSIWSAMVDGVTRNAISPGIEYLGAGIMEVDVSFPSISSMITTGMQHTFSGYDAMTGDKQ